MGVIRIGARGEKTSIGGEMMRTNFITDTDLGDSDFPHFYSELNQVCSARRDVLGVLYPTERQTAWQCIT